MYLIVMTSLERTTLRSSLLVIRGCRNAKDACNEAKQWWVKNKPPGKIDASAIEVSAATELIKQNDKPVLELLS